MARIETFNKVANVMQDFDDDVFDDLAFSPRKIMQTKKSSPLDSKTWNFGNTHVEVGYWDFF